MLGTLGLQHVVVNKPLKAGIGPGEVAPGPDPVVIFVS
jgi:hypothetical protein